MKIIVGLGNPGKKYEKTRHNLGFMVIDKLSQKLDIPIDKEKMEGIIGMGKKDEEKIMLVKPLTYMNLSGDCVNKILRYYKVLPEDLIIIYDDIDIKVGKIRVKMGGKTGTHNGMRDIVNKLDSEEFVRVRVGSGKPELGQDLVEYVLSNIKKEESEEIEKALQNACDAVIEILNCGVQSAMNKYN